MIIKFEQYNESVKSLLVGPSEDEIWNNLKNLSPNELLKKSSEIGFLKGVEIALERGADIHIHSDYSLRWSLEGNHTDVVKLLIDRGADVNKVLYFLISNKKIRLSEELIKYGADLKKLDLKKLLDETQKHFRFDIWKFLRNHGISKV